MGKTKGKVRKELILGLDGAGCVAVNVAFGASLAPRQAGRSRLDGVVPSDSSSGGALYFPSMCV